MLFEKKIPFRKALGFVFLSVCLIWGLFFLVSYYQKYTRGQREQDPSFLITGIIQTTQDEKIPSRLFAELLDLAIDTPQNLYSFDSEAGAKKLRACTIFKRVELHKIPPSFIHIDYEVRTPEVLLGEFENMVCDREGILFPIMPFLTQKNLPEVFTDLENPAGLQLAFLLLEKSQVLFPSSIRCEAIDVRMAFAASAGQREVIAVWQVQPDKKIIVRLLPTDFEARLQDCVRLLPELARRKEERLSLDLRSPRLGFISSIH